MSASKLIKKLFKRSEKTEVEAPSTSTPTAPSPRSPILPPTLHPPPPQTPSQLLSLPGELRNKIYALTIYPSLSTISLHHAPETVLSLPIFAICRQIRREAISTLCSSKNFSLCGLRTANAFFEMVGDGVGDLRCVTVRCETEWRSEGTEMGVEKVRFIEYLALATSLRWLHVVAGDALLAGQEEMYLENADSVGARFLYAVKDDVDREGVDVEEERARFLLLSDQIGALQAVHFWRKKLKEEHKGRAEKVFRLGKVISLEGSVESAVLPLRMPEYLRKTEEDLRTCHDGTNEEYNPI